MRPGHQLITCARPRKLLKYIAEMSGWTPKCTITWSRDRDPFKRYTNVLNVDQHIKSLNPELVCGSSADTTGKTPINENMRKDTCHHGYC